MLGRRGSREYVANPFDPRYEPPAAQQRAIDLEQRREQLSARLAELQWDLGGLVYEMAIRNRIKVDVIVRRAAALQEVDAELGEVERILRTEQTGTAGACGSCGAPHSTGAVYCWQCGDDLMERREVTAEQPAPQAAQPPQPAQPATPIAPLPQPPPVQQEPPDARASFG